MLNSRIYRYVVAYDGGSAPNPFGGWCSLAICKPQIRKTANIGDWIIGLRSGRPDQVIYIMQIEERLSFAEYWNDARFLGKRPDKNPRSDNIYRSDEQGGLAWVENRVHDEGHTERDLGGKYVLVSKKFWYFGDQSPSLPTDLIHLVHQGRAHAVHKNRRQTDMEYLNQWLRCWKPGIYGKPIDCELDLSALVGATKGGCQMKAN
jgi:hypothetical protein